MSFFLQQSNVSSLLFYSLSSKTTGHWKPYKEWRQMSLSTDIKMFFGSYLTLIEIEKNDFTL